MADDVVLIGMPTEVESQLRFHLSGRRLTVFAALPEQAGVVLVWVGRPDAWRDLLSWARTGPVVGRKIALVAHDCPLDPFSAAAAREAGLEAWVPLTPADLPFLLREERHFWQPRGAVTEGETTAPTPQVIEREVERRVAIGTHPVLVSVCGVGSGVGTTTVACALVAFVHAAVELEEHIPGGSLAGYPFPESFDEIVHRLIDWRDAAVSRAP